MKLGDVNISDVGNPRLSVSDCSQEGVAEIRIIWPSLCLVVVVFKSLEVFLGIVLVNIWLLHRVIAPPNCVHSKDPIREKSWQLRVTLVQWNGSDFIQTRTLYCVLLLPTLPCEYGMYVGIHKKRWDRLTWHLVPLLPTFLGQHRLPIHQFWPLLNEMDRFLCTIRGKCQYRRRHRHLRVADLARIVPY